MPEAQDRNRLAPVLPAGCQGQVMTRINFYHDAPDRNLAACKVVAKAVQQKLRVLIYARDTKVIEHVDKLLWTWQSTGFVPHCMAGGPLAAQTPVLLSQECTTEAHDEVLVNLDTECPPGFARFQRLVEIIGTADAERSAGRERFRFYRDRGYEIQAHNLSGADR
jgi:DNA polymerase-3 subunit chi